MTTTEWDALTTATVDRDPAWAEATRRRNRRWHDHDADRQLVRYGLWGDLTWLPQVEITPATTGGVR